MKRRQLFLHPYFNRLREQLLEAGLPEAEAEGNALLWQARGEASVELWNRENPGDLMTLESWAQRYPVDVVREISDPARREVLRQQVSEMLSQFAGPKARTANLTMLKLAKASIAKGADPEEVRQQTGWHQGVDGRWRFEIDDSQARTQVGFKRVGDWFAEKSMPWPLLGEIMVHPALYEAYPELAEIEVEPDPLRTHGANVEWLGDRYRILVGHQEIMSDLLDRLLHEIQHVIQEVEGYAGGGDPRDAFADPRVRPGATRGTLKAAQQILSELIANASRPMTLEEYATEAWGRPEADADVQSAYVEYRQVVEAASTSKMVVAAAQEAAAREWYKRLAGEVEARNTPRRRKLTAEDRRQQSPESTEDVPREQQIVRFARARAMDLGDARFSVASLQRAINAGVDSSDMMIYVSPEWFLNLSGAAEPDKTADAAEVLARDERLRDLPHLELEFEGEQARVVGHEGRHRVAALQALGLELIPVVLYAEGVSWGRQAESASPSRLEAWPKELIGTNGEAVSFPVSREAWLQSPAARTVSPADRDAAFRRLFGKSLVVDENGKPLRVFRGEHGGLEGVQRYQNLVGGLSFGTPAAANSYALHPNDRRFQVEASRVMPAYLRIENPVFNNPDDPFIELSDLAEKLGAEEAVRIGKKFAEAIEDTSSWQDDLSNEFESPVEFLDKNPERLGDLYFSAFRLLDDHEEIERFKAAGFDGAIHMGNGVTFNEAEYRVFDASQVISAIEFVPEGAPPVVLNRSWLDGDDAIDWSSDQMLSQTATTLSGSERQSNFQRWFGESLMRNEDGSPMDFYHGTGGDFEVFSKELRGSQTSAADAERGFFFTTSPQAAGEFAWKDGERGSIMPVYLRVTNPYLTDFVVTPANQREFAKIIDEARSLGHDGVACFLDTFGHESGLCVVFEAEQIKSSLGNDGTFDLEDPSVLSQFAGRKAITADEGALMQAVAMIEAGFMPELIRQETGWFLGHDDEWRFEIDDSAAEMILWGEPSVQALRDANGGEWITPEQFVEKYPEHELSARIQKWAKIREVDTVIQGQKIGVLTVGDVLRHDKLFKAYPWVAEISLVIDDTMRIGSAVYSDDEFGYVRCIVMGPVANPDVALRILSHEIQHGIQGYEGFARGGMIESDGVRIAAREGRGRRVGSSDEIRELRRELELLRREYSRKNGMKRYKGQTAELRENLARDADLVKKIEDLSSPVITREDALNAYRRIAGEVEARNVERRLKFSSEIRAETPPQVTEDIDADRIILLDAAGDPISGFVMSGRDEQVGETAALFDFSRDGEQWRTVKVGDTRVIYGFDGDRLEVASLRTPQAKRGKGSARRAMEALLTEADAQGITVKLGASPLDSRTREAKLQAFYRSLGFEYTGRNYNPAGDPEMVRLPRVSSPVVVRVFHGTDEKVTVFDTAASNDLERKRLGAYFSTSQAFASLYGTNLVSADLTLAKPFDITGLSAEGAIERLPVSSRLKCELRMAFRGFDYSQYGLLETAQREDLRSALEAAGYDGIKYTEGYADAYVAFKPEQIRIIDEPRPEPAPHDADFQKWFGASRIVDESGQAKVVYHGTRLGGFSSFRPNYRKGEQLGFGIHFAESESFARLYAEDDRVARKGKQPEVYAVFLSMQNPLRANSLVHEGSPEFDLGLKLGGKKVYVSKDEKGNRCLYMQHAIDATSPARAEKLIRESGYDGVIYDAQVGTYGVVNRTLAKSESYIVFEPGQIKSATDNDGSFDRDDESILSQSAELPSTAVREAQFNAWFAGSSVIDGQGRPLVVYHGTDADENFDIFSQTSDVGFHFGSLAAAQARLDQGEAGEGARILPVYLSIKNPLRLPDLHTWSTGWVVSALVEAGVLTEEQAEAILESGYFDEVQFAAALEAKGYDGVVYHNETEGGGDSWIALRAEQIKSAVGNDGSFDRDDESILSQSSALPEDLLLEVVPHIGESLTDEQRRNEELGFNRYGAPYRFGPMTASWSRQVLVPVEVLKHLKGALGEQQSVRQDDLDSLLDYMGRHRQLPPASFGAVDQHAAPYIEVWQDGSAWINEGNHRIMAAAQLGAQYLPVDIRYFAGAEAASGPLSPALIKEYDAQARAAGLSLTRYFAAAPASLAKPLLGDEREANLRTWLGDSKIVDADGNPTVLYHGTGGVIDRFDRSRIGSASDAGNASTGAFWLTDMPDVAADFAVMQNDATVMPVYVRMSHPLVVDCAAYARRHLCANQAMRLDNGELIYDINPFKEAALRDARIGGYDGLVFEGGYDEFPRRGRIFAVFQPDQLKSALGNDGSFDRDDESILSQFAGARAENASLVDLEKARVLVEAGADPEQVRKDTGWFKSVDGKWRFEIDDSQCTLRSGSGLNVWEGPVRLADLIDHPQLFNAYPHLEWLDVELTLEGPSGAFNESWNKISILAEDLDQEGLTPKQMKVLLHEIQHAIQAHEGFAAGGDYRDFIDTEELTAREQYFYLAGEAEARNTMRRRALTEAERLEHSPASTADVPVDRQIVRWNGVPMHSASIESAAGLPPEVVGDVRVVEDVRGAHHGQLDVTLRVLVNDEEVGTLDYSRFGGKPYINMIHVAPQARRRGYAQRMVQELQRQYPGEEIQWGLLSEEGAKLFAAMPKVEVGTEFKPLFEQLDRMKAECDRHMAVVAQFRDTPMPSTELRSGYEAALAVLNDLHSDISSLEFTLENEKRTITLIRTDVPEALEVLSQFAGQKARTADLGRLSLAKAGIASGLDAELVRQETGWHKGLDGHWRFEIDDSGAFLLSELFGRQVKAARRLDAADAEFQALEEELRKRISSGELSEVVAQELLEEGRAAVMAVRDEVDPIIGIVEYPARPLAVGVTMPLREVLYHPALFEAYPELAEMPVNGVSRAEGGTLQGWFDGRTLNVVVEKITSDELLETLSHEIQHAVQEIEQFAPGGTAAYFKDISLVEELTRPINARLNELLNSDPEFGSLKRQQHRTFAALQSAYGEDTERGRKLDWEKVPVEKHDAYMDLLDLLAGYEQYWEYNELETKRFYIERDQPVLTAHEQYRRLVGEVEARNTESRRLLSTAERRATSPVATEDVPAVEQKVAAPGHRPRVASVEELRITIGTVPDSGDFGADTKLYLAEMLPESFTVYRAIWLAEGEEPRLDSPGSYWAETPEGARRSGFGPADGKHRLCLLEADARRDDINVWASTARRRRYGEPEIVFNEGPSSPRIYESPVEIEPGLTMAQASPYHPEFPPLPPVQRRLPLGWPAEAAEGVDSLAFKDWFGASKAVDQNGRPLVLFHGTRRDVEAFDAQEARKTGRPMVPDSTFYFTDSAGVASSYAGLREDMTGRLQQLEGGNVMPVYLSLQRPMVVNARGANWDDIFWDGDYWSTNDLAVRARLAGHDGLIIRNVKDVGAGQSVPANNYVVFSSEQVKSAIGNDGSYDRDDASILSQFAGRQAANADLARLDVAVAALLAGEDAEVVRQQTGWHKGVDGAWRFEIDDSQARFHSSTYAGGSGTLGSILDHPALYEAYPELAEIEVEASILDVKKPLGVFDGKVMKVTAGSQEELLGGILHEVQHAIQDIEGFARGGLPKDMAEILDNSAFEAVEREHDQLLRSERAQYIISRLGELSAQWSSAANAIPDEVLDEAAQLRNDPVSLELIRLQKAGEKLLMQKLKFGGRGYSESELFAAYQRLAGEVEARNTQMRRALSVDERLAIAPQSTADISAGDQIVVLHDEPAPAAMFAGREAGSANLGRLAQAQSWLAAGRDAELVRQQTGWHKGPDGQWRFEIDDSTAGLDKGFFDLVRGERSEVPLDQVLMHPALFDAYPDLRNISVSMADLGNSNAVLVGLEHLLLSYGMAAEQGWHSFLQALLHEVQHAIQDLEGFAIGGSPRDKSLPSREALAGAINAEYSARAEAIERSEAYQAFVQVELAKVPEDQRYREGRNGLYDYGLSLANQSAWSRFIEPVEVERNARLTELFAIGGLFPRENEIAYRLLAGEAEARNTVARMELAAAQRQSIAPVATLDVPADWLIVRSREEGRALVSASEPLDLLPSMLLPRGDNPAIGEEQGTVRRDGISTFRSPHGSTRYVLSRNGVAIAALQVVGRDGRHALVANIYTHPDHRRQGLATKLLVKARQDFARVDISDDLTADGKAWVLGLEDDGQSLSQTASVEDRAPAMLALHNLNEVKLRFADRLGGLAAPSIAVITEERGELKEFGEITLIGTREMADPQQVPVFDADAYTLRFPDPQYGKAKQAGLDRLCRQVREISKEFHDGSLEMETLNAAENNDLQRILRLWGQSDAVKALFLREQGFEVMPVMRGKHLPGMVTREHMQPLIPLIDAIDRDRPMGEQMSSEAFGLLRDAYVLAVRASHPDAFDGSETQEVVDAYCNFDRGPYLALRQAAEMVRTGGVEGFDRSGTRTLIKGIFAERGLVHAFDTWLGARWEGVFGDPFLKVGRSRVPYDLENITEAMISGQVHGQEETLVFGPGNARAHAAHRFTSFEEMHAFATGSLGSVAEVEAARKEGEQHLDAFREKVWRYHKSTNYRGEVSVWDANSDALRALSKLVKARTKDVATLRSLLSKSDFAVGSLPAEVLELGLKAYDELMSSPVPYFEAKPQRAVTLGEFAGAVIPQDAAPEVREILARHGLAVREYPAGDAEARHEAILKHARELAVARPDVLFGRIEPELTIVSETAARQQAFEAWFGQSVLRTSTGEPLVLYHGTHASFDRFDSFKQGTISDAGWYGAGFYFSPLASEANKYAREDGASVMPVYVRIERPYYWHDENERGLIQNYGPASQEKTAELKTAGYDGVIVAKDYYSFANGMSDESWQLLIEASPVLANIGRERLPQLLASNEYPYAKLRDMYGKAFVDSLTPVRTEIVEVVAFEDTQIKSAIGNDGSYDRNDPSILSQSEGQRASGVRFFSTAALEQAAGAEGRLVLMHPADFLALAAPEYPEEDKALVLRELLEQGGQIDAVPVLTLRSNSDGGTQVDIHDGRHRARELLRRGVEVMPVLLNGVEPAEKIRGQGDNYRNEVVTPAPALGSQSSNEVGGPSILSQSAALPVILERQLNLLRWLGSNPLLNDAGEPLVLYHGTRSAEGLDRFIPGGPAGAEQTGDAYGVASYFTTNPLEASVYGTEGAVLPVYVRGKLLDVELPELSVADAERLTAFANAILLPSDKARFPMGRAERRFSAEELEDAKDFFESCRANWEQFGDKMERAKPEVDKDGDIFIVRYTDFDAPVAIRTGDDAFTLFSAVGWDNLPAAGFDGLVMARENGQKWVVMHRPEGNVKSALGNNGQFSELDARILHQFAGEKARTANLDRLIRARMQVAAGDSPEKVRLETGWHQGADEQWRFEIDDSLARVKLDGLALLRQARQPECLVAKVSYRLHNDGCADLVLVPEKPKSTREIVSLSRVPGEFMVSMLPDEVRARMLAGEGSPDFIGPNWDDALEFPAKFRFSGFNAVPLSDLFDHPELFRAYPEFADIPVMLNPGHWASAMGASLEVSEDGHSLYLKVGIGLLASPDEALRSISHELQHAIQVREGFAMGAVCSEEDRDLAVKLRAWELGRRRNTATEEELEQINRELSSLANGELTVKEAYRRSAGEVEARNTEKRLSLSAAERQQMPPHKTADVPFADTIKRFAAPAGRGQAGVDFVERAQIRFNRNLNFTVALFEHADASSFIHESGHAWLEILRDMAERTKARDSQLRKDWETLQAWLRIEGLKKGEKIPVRAHEQFARGWEAYVLRGVAPSKPLAGVFQRFSQWMKSIYRSVKSLFVRLTPEVTEVMDRMLAADAGRQPEPKPARDGHQPEAEGTEVAEPEWDMEECRFDV